MATTEAESRNMALANSAKFAGEIFVPGASDVIAGNIGRGVAQYVAAGVAVAVLAPTMPLLAAIAAIGIRANSYKHATTGRNLWDSRQRQHPSADNTPQAVGAVLKTTPPPKTT